jgi:7,8-dihydro-6-hydroxymethylpterin-pyrophosphokinase
MNNSSMVLIGVEAGILKGLDTMRWTIESLQRFSEVVSVSTVVQSSTLVERPCIRVVVKVSLAIHSEQVVQELIAIENEYDEKLKVMEPIHCYLLAQDQTVCLTPEITLPHPQMVSNAAWLYCSWEVWRNYRHPVLDLTLERILSQTNVTNVEFFSQGKAVVSKTSLG